MKANVIKKLKKLELVLRKSSPEIFTVLAIGTGVAGVVVACKKTLIIEEQIAPYSHAINEIKENAAELEEKPDKKELTKAYCKAGGVILKNFAPVIFLEGTSITCILAANNIMKKRNAGLVAAYGALDQMFKQYRHNVVEELGEEQDYMFFHSLKKDKVETEEVDPETGKKKRIKKDIYIPKNENSGISMYGVTFDSYNGNHVECPSLNRAFIKGVQIWANKQLRINGYLFLSDVYDALGYEVCMLNENQAKASRVVGWVYDENLGGDGHVDLGIFAPINRLANMSADDNEQSGNASSEVGENVYIIDFNVDGPIIDIFAKGSVSRELSRN